MFEWVRRSVIDVIKPDEDDFVVTESLEEIRF